MCLAQSRSADRRDDTGRMCVRNMPFVSVTSINGNFNANGIVGLAPHMGDKSYVEQLYNQGQIDEKIVGLNFEDPTDHTMVSTVSFGFIDYNQIAGGDEGFNYYTNIGINHWAVLMDDVQYMKNGIGLGQGGKMAVIDSGNTTI